MPLGLIIIHYLFLSDCERTLAAKLFVVPEYLLLFITIDAFASIALPVIFPVFLCDNTLAANDLNLKKDYFLGDPEKIKKLMEAVADQGKTNPGGRK